MKKSYSMGFLLWIPHDIASKTSPLHHDPSLTVIEIFPRNDHALILKLFYFLSNFDWLFLTWFLIKIWTKVTQCIYTLTDFCIKWVKTWKKGNFAVVEGFPNHFFLHNATFEDNGGQNYHWSSQNTVYSTLWCQAKYCVHPCGHISLSSTENVIVSFETKVNLQHVPERLL